MKQFCILLFIGMIFSNSSLAQLMDPCGTSYEDQLRMIPQRILFPEQSRTSTNYIPVQFHLIQNDDGKGAQQIYSMLDMLDQMNQHFKPNNFAFYIDDVFDWGFTRNSRINSSPRDNVASIRNLKNPNAVNIFITAELQDAGGIYYSGSNDFIVIPKVSVTPSRNVFEHEVGHFFNLRHTFFGWESEPYQQTLHGNPVSITRTPISNREIELMNRSNCDVAGDLICDTPPDYQFALNASNCSFGSKIMDYNGDTIITMPHNHMGYFFRCNYAFTEGQYTAMLANYFSPARAHIRSSYVPNTSEVSESAKQVFPLVNQTIPHYNYVDFKWEAQNGADYYLFEIYNNNEYFPFIVTDTVFAVLDLLQPKTTYFWRIRGFNDGNTSRSGIARPFKTGDLISSMTEVENSRFSFTVYPNPISHTQMLNISCNHTKSEKIEVNVYNSNGMLLSKNHKFVVEGQQIFELTIPQSANGICILEIKSDAMSKFQKFVVVR